MDWLESIEKVENRRYTGMKYRRGTYVRMYSHVAVLGSQLRSISATSILVMDRTLVVDGLQFTWRPGMYPYIIALVYNGNGMYCSYYATCRCSWNR